MYIDRRDNLNITPLSDHRVLITLCHDDMNSFDLSFEKIGLSDPHSKKILSRLMTLATSCAGIELKNKVIVLEALENCDGVLLLVSVNEKKTTRKKYRIKRIKECPCFRFTNCEDMLCAINKLYNTNILFYNNSAYFYNDKYYLVFDYPVVSHKAKRILTEYSSSVRGTKPFVARLNESGKNLSHGNAIINIGSSL